MLFRIITIKTVGEFSTGKPGLRNQRPCKRSSSQRTLGKPQAEVPIMKSQLKFFAELRVRSPSQRRIG